MEFLRERFSDSHNLRTEDNHKDDSSNDTATILHLSQATPPAATSTPQQSRSIGRSTSPSFQFHSDVSRIKPPKDRSSASHSEKYLRNEVHSM